MIRFAKTSRAAALAAVLAMPVPILTISTQTAQAASSDQTQVIDRARQVVEDVKKDKAFGNATDLASHARAILIVPRLFKAGFFLGGEGGDGVLLARGDTGWSDPAFYTLASASFGLQIGAEESELVLFIMSDRALQAVLSNEFKIGANAAFAVVTLGSSAEAATTSAMKADIVVWASSSGAYAGLTLNGSVIKPRDSYNAAFYGTDTAPRAILMRRSVGNPEALSLQTAVRSLS